MRRGPLVIASAAAVAFSGGVASLLVADHITRARLTEGCATPVEVPGAAVLLTSLGVGLLLGTVVVLASLVVILARSTFRWKAMAVVVVVAVAAGICQYAATATFTTVPASAALPSSPDGPSCA
ncbi:hypothetical protein AB0L62_01055 [Nocardia asteroides]|uniref:hypothetical protein n=1 Tax=Nocardia asteroides TaxID=1824 RepID=UPI0034449C34